MKKILLPLLCTLLATACMKESTFYMENFSDFATVYEGKLVTDTGYHFVVVETTSETEGWKVDGRRYFIICDILNRNLDIRLKNLLDVDVEEALPYTEQENEPDDPVEVLDQSISGGYINLALNLYEDPTSNAEHVLSFYYEAQESANDFTFYVLHEGNHENPQYMDEKKLEKQERVISIPLWDLLKRGVPSTLKLCIYTLKKADDGTFTVEKNTYPLHGGNYIL